MVGDDVRLVEHYHPTDEMEPYERLLGDALRGDRILFGNEEGVEAAWRIVDPVLDNVTEFRRPQVKRPKSAAPPSRAKPRLPVAVIFACIAVVYVGIRYFWR